MGIGLDWAGSGRIGLDRAGLGRGSSRGLKHPQALNGLFGRLARLGWIGPD